MSFLKQEPPKPTDASKNLLPILVSAPTALETSWILAPDSSHKAERLFIEETLCAKNALDANFDNSDDHKFVVIIFSWETQWLYILVTSLIASFPDGVWSPPIRTLSGFIRSSIADPSARNSGLDITSNFTLLFELSVFLIFSAVPIGDVDF